MAWPAAGITAAAAGSMAIGGEAAHAVGSNLAYRQAKKATRQMQGWQEYMRSTAYQTSVEDMKKAGLNPILSVTGPGAAQTPGPSIRTETPNMGGAFGRGSGQAAMEALARLRTVKAGALTAASTADITRTEAAFRGAEKSVALATSVAQKREAIARAEASEYIRDQELHGISTARENARIRALQREGAETDARRAVIEREVLGTPSGEAAYKTRQYLESLPITELLLGAIGGFFFGRRRSRTPEVKRKRKSDKTDWSRKRRDR